MTYCLHTICKTLWEAFSKKYFWNCLFVLFCVQHHHRINQYGFPWLYFKIMNPSLWEEGLYEHGEVGSFFSSPIFQFFRSRVRFMRVWGTFISLLLDETNGLKQKTMKKSKISNGQVYNNMRTSNFNYSVSILVTFLTEDVHYSKIFLNHFSCDLFQSHICSEIDQIVHFFCKIKPRR